MAAAPFVPLVFVDSKVAGGSGLLICVGCSELRNTSEAVSSKLNMDRRENQRSWIDPMAVACADSFKRAASAYIVAGTARSELPEGPAPSDHRFGDLSVCASNLAFAIEIYLKTLRAQLGLP